MQIVIGIDEEYIKQIDRIRFLIGGKEDRSLQINVINAIKKGIPLPKGHGRLIDADITKDFKNKIKHYGKDYKFTQEEILNILERYEIKYAPTIIEADKEE